MSSGMYTMERRQRITVRWTQVFGPVPAMDTGKPSVNRGDLCLTKTIRGYLVTRRGSGGDSSEPWWFYLAVIFTFADAAYFARVLADRDGVRAWIRIDEEQYELLRDEEPVDSARQPPRSLRRRDPA